MSGRIWRTRALWIPTAGQKVVGKTAVNVLCVRRSVLADITRGAGGGGGGGGGATSGSGAPTGTCYCGAAASRMLWHSTSLNTGDMGKRTSEIVVSCWSSLKCSVKRK